MVSEFPTKSPLDLLDRHDDPFAPREGKNLIWKDINMTLVCVNATFSSIFFLRFLYRVNLTVSSFLYVREARLPKVTNQNVSY
jgi:hypothetical protein